MLRRRLFLVCVLIAGSMAFAQTVQCVPKKDCNGPLQFAPSQAQLVAALGSTLQPTAPSMPIQLKVHAGKGAGVAAEVSRSPWIPAAPIVVEAQITVSGPQVATRTLDWMPLSETPRTLVVGDSQLTNLAFDYRLRVNGSVAPGSYTATVRYHVWDGSQLANGESGTTITSLVTVIVPAFVVLRVDGGVAGQVATVRFDYGGGNAAAYVAAIGAKRPLAFTSANFQHIDVATNDPLGYRVQVSVSESTATQAQHPGVGDVLIRGEPAQGTVLTSAHSTDGFQALLTPGDFGVHVDGSETPGSYVFRVTFQAFANP